MSRHDDRVRLRHMLDYAIEAIELTQGKTMQDLRNTRLLQLGLVRLMEVIGEAASKVTPATRLKSSEIPWQDIVGMRNRLIHGYDNMDLNILWMTIQNDLPPLIVGLRKLLAMDEV